MGAPLYHPSESLGLVIDGPNTLSAANDLGERCDWGAFLTNFEGARLFRAVYVSPFHKDEDGNSTLKPMLDFLAFNGFEVKARSYHFDNDVRPAMHVDLTLSAVDMIGHVNHLFLFSGDGTFTPLVGHLRRCGVRVTVGGVQDVVAASLRRSADRFVDLRDLALFRDSREAAA